MKRLLPLSLALLCLGTLGSSFAADHSYWTGTEVGFPEWQMPSPTAAGPFWGGTNGVEAGRMFETRKQLLFAINIWMKKYHQPELTMDNLIVRIASQENFLDPDPRLEELLEYVVNNKSFKRPIDLWTGWSNGIKLSEEHSSGERLRLPAHCTLAIRILNAPWGSKDQNGISPKITYWEFPIAYALETKKRKAKQTP